MTSETRSRIGALRRKVEVAQTFLRKGLWLSLPQRGLPRAGYQLLRMGVLTVEGLVRSDTLTLAAALTFKVVFALMPFLAVVLALFKAFGGASGDNVEKMKGFLFKNLAPNVGTQYAGELDKFIGNINATAIGIVGFLLLTYTAVSLLDTVEKAFNRMWGIKTPRPLLRRVTVYWTLLTLAPVLLGLSITMSAFVQSHGLYLWLMEHVPGFGRLVLTLTPFACAWLLFTGLYVFMPNTRVNIGAAFVGALVAGTSWELMKAAYVWYNAHVVTSYKFYGSLGAIPVFLLWVYFSWVVVLFGSEIAFAAQHVKTYRREVEEMRLSQADRERLALVIAIEVVKPFEKGAEPPTADAVAALLNAPVRAVNEVTFQLVAKGILREVGIGDRKDAGLVPARDPAAITARDVVEALRSYGDPFALPAGEETAKVYKLIDEAQGRAIAPLGNVTLKDLAS